MKNSVNNTSRPPWWYIILLVVLLLPLLCYPVFWSCMQAHPVVGADAHIMRFITYAFPVYVVLNQWISYREYYERKTLVWILQVVLALVYLLCVWLVYYAMIC